ncbi:MAG: DUF308 domain-containing protein [Legionellaceae bacterium]|nr:DUF308 domain-containing protein [Legionellaceae bacterium]
MLSNEGRSNRSWAWLLGLGVLFVTLSFICLSQAIGVTLVSIFFVGIIFMIAGGAQLIDVFKSKEWNVSIGHSISAVFYIAIGGLIIYDPILASSIITIFIALSFIIIGITRFIMAISLKTHNAGWFFLIINSVVSTLLGGFILAYWPLSSLWVLGILITVELMISGWSYIFLAFAIRRNLK